MQIFMLYFQLCFPQLSDIYYWLLLSRRMSQHRDWEENYWEDSGEDVAPNFCHKRYWVNLKMVGNSQPVTEYKNPKKENLNKKKFENVSSRQLILKNASQ